MSILLMMAMEEQEVKVEDCIGCYLFLLNDVNKSVSLSQGQILKLQAERCARERKPFSE